MTRLILLAALLLSIACCDNRKCLKGHNEIRHYPARTHYISTGKIMFPVHRPAHDVLEFVCDEYAVEEPL
jgi:hypothetical protein